MKGAKRAVAVDVTGLPLAATVLPASTHENIRTEVLLDVLGEQGQAVRLELVLVDRGVTPRKARSSSHKAALEVRRVGHDKGRDKFVPLAYAWRVEVATGTCCAAAAWPGPSRAPSSRPAGGCRSPA